MTDSVLTSDAAAIIASTMTLDKIENFDASTLGTMPFVSVPSGRRIASIKDIIDQFRKRPEAAIGFARLHDAASFMAHVNRHKFASESVIFADREKSRFVAVYDYHDTGTTGRSDTGANWCRHGSLYNAPTSPEWKAWRERENEFFDGPSFARFLDDRIADVVAEPMQSVSLSALRDRLGGSFATPSQLMDLSRNLTINVAAQVKSAFTLSSGEMSLAYAEQHQDGQGQPIKVPTLFAIGIPVYRNGTAYQLPVRLSYRLNGPAVKWSYTLYRAEDALDLAFKDASRAIADGTGLLVLAGEPDNTILVPV